MDIHGTSHGLQAKSFFHLFRISCLPNDIYAMASNNYSLFYCILRIFRCQYSKICNFENKKIDSNKIINDKCQYKFRSFE